jgi:hypothetical protein
METLDTNDNCRLHYYQRFHVFLPILNSVIFVKLCVLSPRFTLIFIVVRKIIT